MIKVSAMAKETPKALSYDCSEKMRSERIKDVHV